MSKIDKDKPLPYHTKLRYEECVAKVFLERYFFERYGMITIVDRPDLYSKKADIGIEVTEAVDPNKKEAERMWYTMPYLKTEKEKQNHINRMEELGVHFVSEGVQSWPGQAYYDGANSDPYVVLYSALQTKLEKIKAGKYKRCEKYEIFIEGEMMPRAEWSSKLTSKIKDVIDKVGLKPNRVYLLTQGILQAFDFDIAKTIWIDTGKEYDDLVCKARELVEEAEENE